MSLSDSRNPLFAGKDMEIQLWMEAIRIKGCIYYLLWIDMVSLAYNYTEGPASDWFGKFFERNFKPKCKQKLQGISV